MSGGRLRHKAAVTVAREVSTPAVTISADATIVEAARRIDESGVKRLPTVDADGRLVGIIAPRDILGVFLRPDDETRQEIIDEVFDTYPHTSRVLITVDVRDGVADLSGEVAAASQIPLAVRTASMVDGVVAVRDHLAAVVDDRRVPRTADTTDY